MRSRVNLVVITLTLVCLASGLDSSWFDISRSETVDAAPSNLFSSVARQDSSRRLKNRVSTLAVSKIVGNSSPSNKMSVVNKITKRRPLTSTAIATKTNKHELIHDLGSKTRTALERRESKKKSKKKRNRALMALLLAYKLKFAALVPTMAGGLVLLISTTALAGFFFALFAAVLGLKAH